MNDRFWMQKAYDQALLAQLEGEVPIGAVLVSKDNKLLGIGRNTLQNSHDPSDHAEKLYRVITSSNSLTLTSGVTVTGSLTMPLSNFLTVFTSSACSLILMFL